jgi:hypothetical protein
MALLDFEGGVLDVLDGLPGFGTDCVHIPIHSWDDFNQAYERVRSNDEGFKSVAIDSLSETHIFALMTIIDEQKSRRDDPDLIQQGDYGKGLVQLRRLVRYFRDLPIHTFYTAHHRDDVDPKEGMIKLPNLAGKAAVEIPGMMSLVGYLALMTEYDEAKEKDVAHRVLLLQNYAKIRIGVRAPWGVEPPDEIEDPTVTNVLDTLGYKY